MVLSQRRWHDPYVNGSEPKNNKNYKMSGWILLTLLSASLGLLGQTPDACEGKKLPEFKDYAASVYYGKAHAPILVTSLDRSYRTRIRAAAAKGPNFAGHYALARWGCGSGCHEFVIIDLKTGAVYDLSFDRVEFHYGSTDDNPGWQCFSDLVMHRPDSSLLVVEGCLWAKQCGRTYFVMESGRLRQVAYDPDRLRDSAVAPF
jgi:hypothetical protein